MKRYGIGVSLFILLLLAVGTAELVISSVQPVGAVAGETGGSPSEEPVSLFFVVEEGDTASQIARKLMDKRLIRSPLPFLVLVKYKGIEGNLKSGAYHLHRGMNLFEIAAELEKGQEPDRVTIVEGWRAEEIGSVLESRGILRNSDFIAAVKEQRPNLSILGSRPVRSSLEGYLFPDTYEAPPDLTAKELVELMVGNLDKRFTREMRDKAREAGLTVHQVITLASIVEREARVPEERPIIAGVFLNRLEQGIPLAADPTVQYALSGDGIPGANGYWKGQLTEEDLTIASPYNTYLNPGLPPNPICNPGMAAIQAVLNPAKTGYLYFVVRKDGRHMFSTTYEEHLLNIALADGQAGASP